MWAPDPAGGGSWAHDECGCAAVKPTPTAALLRDAEPARPASNELLAVAEHHWPNPAAHPRPAGRQGWGVDPPGLDRPATPPGRRPGPPGAPAVIGRLTTHRQRRRRITPNTNTTTTTMISTHNHVDMAASLVGPGQFKLTLLPATRASNSVTARPPPGPGSTAALRAGSRGPLRWAEPFGPRPAQPSPTRRIRQASTDPTQPQRDHSEPDRRIWQGREEVALLGWGQCELGRADARWQTPRRRRRTDGARLRRNPNFMVSHLMLDRFGLGGWSTPSRARVDYLGRP
jgi:hypothetical protein